MRRIKAFLGFVLGILGILVISCVLAGMDFISLLVGAQGLFPAEAGAAAGISLAALATALFLEWKKEVAFLAVMFIFTASYILLAGRPKD
jgi:hypothetical protein